MKKQYTTLAAFAALFVAAMTLMPSASQAAPAPAWTLGISSASSATVNQPQLEGGATVGNGPAGSTALVLNGNEEYGDVTGPGIDTSSSFTVSAWVRLDSLVGYQTFVSIDGNEVSNFFLQLRGDSHAFGLSFPDADSERSIPVITSTDPPQAGQWYHLAAVYNADTSTISLYVDGYLQESAVVPKHWQAQGHLEIGRGKYNANPTDFVHGTIADVRIFKAALSASDISSLSGMKHPAPTLTVDCAHPGAHVSPTFYGLMTEEINHSYDGGLYAELIRNRIFRNDPAKPVDWSLVSAGSAAGSIALDNSQPINAALTTCLKLEIDTASRGERVGAANDGYYGMPVKPHLRYRASFYAKAGDGFSGPVTVDIEKSDGSAVYASGTVPKLSSSWRHYTVELTAHATGASADNRFVISASRPGTIWLNLVSLFPPTYHNTPNGNRIDIMEKLAAMKPTFLRLPGGNYLEGNTISERFEWKNTIGLLSARAGHNSPWGYRSTDGLGLLEYLEWCEDLHMQPLLAVYAGYSLDGEHIAPGPQLTPYVQDALDEIQYVSGPSSSKWGAVRAHDGHPKPFALSCVEIGNEDGFDRSHTYDGRFTQFYDAIKAAYPRLKLIATATVTTRTPDIYDEHFYPSPGQMEGDWRHYDSYKRSGPKIFVGEWASQEGQPTPDMNSALGDAAWLIGLERNSDIVLMESYAPLFVNVADKEWGTNLIGYNALTSYGSPSYWVQVVFASHHGNRVLPTSATPMIGLFAGATRDSGTGTISIKVVNAHAAAEDVVIHLTGIAGVSRTARSIVIMSEHPTDTNTINEPTNIVPTSASVAGIKPTFEHVFPPYSITVLEIKSR